MGSTSFLKEPVGAKSVVTRIVDNITNAVLNGELNQGDKLPTENELAQSMEVGRNSVREAIKILEAYGVVHIKRAEGTFVNQEYNSKMIYPILYGIILQKDAGSQIVELRKMIDVGILHLVIEKIRDGGPDGSGLAGLEQAFSDLKEQACAKEVKLQQLHEADVAFHAAIVRITENTMLETICAYVDKVTCRSRIVTLDQILQNGEAEGFLDLHGRMVDLLKERDTGRILETVKEHYHYWAQEKVLYR